jgi:hypothetical protein
MPLFDLFKKPAPKPSQEEIFGSPDLQVNRVSAAQKVMAAFSRYFGNPEQAHVGTVLSTAAWLAGTSLYRSFGYESESQLEPGNVILSEKANQEWPKLAQLFNFCNFQNGIRLGPDQFILEVPAAHKPLKTILKIQEEYQDEYNAIMQMHGLDYLEGARAGIIVCSMLFTYHCSKRKDMDPRLGAGIISVAIVTGAKTVPVPLIKSGAPADPPAANDQAHNKALRDGLKQIAANSVDGSGTRLVLGEVMAAMQDAIAKGGRYILVHPEILNMLKEKNIDGFIIYEAAMRIEIETKISRIDYVSGNIDGFLQEWNGKEHLAPMHIRQVLWLQANAQGFGYEKRGNSWLLK